MSYKAPLLVKCSQAKWISLCPGTRENMMGKKAIGIGNQGQADEARSRCPISGSLSLPSLSNVPPVGKNKMKRRHGFHIELVAAWAPDDTSFRHGMASVQLLAKDTLGKHSLASVSRRG